MGKDLKKLIEEIGILKGFKNIGGSNKLLKELHSGLLELMLHGELEAHLRYSKNEKREFGESTIEVLHDRS